jgi:DNA repair protein RadC
VELLAILLGSGAKDSDVLTVAGRILKAIDRMDIDFVPDRMCRDPQ